MDEPLGPDDTKERYTTFVASYKIHLRPWDKGSDMLLGRVTRESEKWTMTFMPLEKVRDLKNTQVLLSTKRQKLTDDVDLLTRNPEEKEEAPITSPMPYLHGLRVYCTTLAVGGNRKVLSKADGAGTEVCYAPLSDMFNYFSLAEEKTHTFMKRHPTAGNTSVCQWLRIADEATRTRVMELVRTEPQRTVGEAFGQAMHECAHEWAIPKALTQTSSDRPAPAVLDSGLGNNKRLQDSPPPRRAGKGGGAAASGDYSPPKQYDSRSVCYKWNDQRGCIKPCPDSRGHGPLVFAHS